MFLDLCTYRKASQNNFDISWYLSQNVKDKKKRERISALRGHIEKGTLIHYCEIANLCSHYEDQSGAFSTI